MAVGERRSTSGNAVTTSPTANFNSSVSTFVVALATGYPDGTNGPFFVRVDSEVIKCTSRSGTTFNVQTVPVTGRGWDNTSAASHTTSSVVDLVFTATDADDANKHYADASVDNHTQYLNVARHDVTSRHPASVLPLGSPGNSAPGDTANAGVASSVARSDHRHGREADSTTRVGCTLEASVFAVPSGATTTISWTTETADTDGFIAVPNATITIPSGKGGLYSFTVRGLWASTFTEYKQLIVRLNGSGIAIIPLAFDNLLTTQWAAGMAVIPLSATNTLQFDLQQFNAGSQNVSAHIDLYRVAA